MPIQQSLLLSQISKHKILSMLILPRWNKNIEKVVKAKNLWMLDINMNFVMFHNYQYDGYFT